MPKLPLFVQPPKPEGHVEYIDENDPRKQTSFLDAPADFVRGLGYFPTEPLPPDASKAYSAGAAVANTAPLLGPALKGLGMAAPLITIFKDTQGVPSATARAAGTESFLSRAAGWPQEMYTAAQEFAGKYPRIAAHIKPSYGEIPEIPKALAAAQTPWGKVEKPVEVILTPRGADRTFHPSDVEAGLDQARNIMFHEGTHVAQALGNKDFNPLYQTASDLVGYGMNPFEWSAQRAGGRAMGLPRTGGIPPAIEQLRNLASHPSQEGQTLRNILQRRAGAAPETMAVASEKPLLAPVTDTAPAVDLSRLPASLDYVQGVLKEHGLAPVASHETDPAMQALREAFEGPLPEPSLQQHAATSRVTGRLMPKREMMDLPEGFEMPPGFRMGRREMPEEQKVWRAWAEAQKKLKYDPRETSPEAFPEVRQVEHAPVAKGVEELQNLPVTGEAAKEQAPLIGTWGRNASTRTKKEGRIPFGQLQPSHIKEIQQAAGSGLNQKQLMEKFPQYTKETLAKAVKLPWKD